MKNVFLSLSVFIMPMLFSCAGGAATFNDAAGKEWILTEIRSGGKTVHLDRLKYQADNMGNFYTIIFQDEKVNGIGAPNRYFGPYTTGSGKKLNIGNVASTLMAAFREPEEIKEHEYFAHLANVSRWDIKQGKLELYAGKDTVLIYTLK